MQDSECKGWIDEEAWNSGFYIRYLIRELGSKAKPNGEVVVYIHFAGEKSVVSPGGLGNAERRVDYGDGGVPPWRIAKPVAPKPGVRPRNRGREGQEGQGGHDAGKIARGGSIRPRDPDADSVEAAEALAAAEEKVNKIKERITRHKELEEKKMNWIRKRLEKFEEPAQQPESMSPRQPQMDTPGPSHDQPGTMSQDRPASRSASYLATRGSDLSISPLSTGHAIPPTQPGENPNISSKPLESSLAKSPSRSLQHSTTSTPAPDQVPKDHQGETENVIEMVDHPGETKDAIPVADDHDAQATNNGPENNPRLSPLRPQPPSNDQPPSTPQLHNTAPTNLSPTIQNPSGSNPDAPTTPTTQPQYLSPLARYLNSIKTGETKIKQEPGLTPEVFEPNRAWKAGRRVGERQERVVIDLDSD